METWGKLLYSRRVNPGITPAVIGRCILKTDTHILNIWRLRGVCPCSRSSQLDFSAVYFCLVPDSWPRLRSTMIYWSVKLLQAHSPSQGSQPCLRELGWLLPEGICLTSNLKFIKQQSQETCCTRTLLHRAQTYTPRMSSTTMHRCTFRYVWLPSLAWSPGGS